MVRITLFLTLLFPLSLFGQSSWEELPSPTGTDGADQVVTYNGTIYTISHLGSWRSIDSGQNWIQIETPPLASVTTLLVDSTGMLIAAGSTSFVEQHTLYSSRDGGGEWSRAEGIAESITEGSMVVDQDGSWLLTSSTYPLRRSRNRGDTWEEVTLPLKEDFTYDYSTIARFPDDRLAISFGNLNSGEGYQFMSTDGGENWMGKDSTPVLRYIPISENIYYTIRYGFSNLSTYLQREQIDGTRFDRQLLGIPVPKTYRIGQGSGDTLYLVAGSLTPWLLDRLHLYRSIDFGETWETVDAFSNVNLQDVAVLGERVLVFGTGGPFASTDGGTTWHISNRGTSRYSVQDLQVAPIDESHYIIGGGLALIEEFSPLPDNHHAWINPVETFTPTMMTLTGDGSLFVTNQRRSLWRLHPDSITFSPLVGAFRNPDDPDAQTAAHTIGAIEYSGQILLLLGLKFGGVDAYNVERNFWYVFPRPNDYDTSYSINHLATTNEHIFTEAGGRVYRLAAKDLVSNEQNPDAWVEVLKVSGDVVVMNGTRTEKILVASSDTLFLSHDNGETWDHILPAEFAPGYRVTVAKALVTSVGKLYMSTTSGGLGPYAYVLNTVGSSGEEWTDVSVDTEKGGDITAFAESPDGTLYVVANHVRAPLAIYRAERPSSVEEATFQQVEQIPMLSIVPNPVGGGGSIEIGSTLQGDAVRITDLLGRQIATLPVTTTESFRVETGTLSPGAYVVELLREGEKVAWNMVRVIR